MAELCFNCMNRSGFFLGEEDPNLPGQFIAARKAGFRLLGPDAYSIRKYVEAGGQIEELARLLDEAGMRCFELPTLLVGEDLDELRRDVDELLRMAQILRPDFLQVNVTARVDERLRDELRRVGDRFASTGTGLAIEYLPWMPEIRNLQSTRDLMNRLEIEGSGIILDTWHFFFSDDSWQDLERIALEEIAYVQFDDHPALISDDLVAETVGRRVMPGEGRFELERFCEVLRAKAFDGVVSCEILSDATRAMPLDEFASQVYTSCRRYWPG